MKSRSPARLCDCRDLLQLRCVRSQSCVVSRDYRKLRCVRQVTVVACHPASALPLQSPIGMPDWLSGIFFATYTGLGFDSDTTRISMAGQNFTTKMHIMMRDK